MSKGNHSNNASTWHLSELIRSFSFYYSTWVKFHVMGLRRFCSPVVSTVGFVYACRTVFLYCNWLLFALNIVKWSQLLWCLCFFWDPSLQMALVLDHEQNSNKNDLDTLLQPSSLSLSIYLVTRPHARVSEWCLSFLGRQWILNGVLRFENTINLSLPKWFSH